MIYLSLICRPISEESSWNLKAQSTSSSKKDLTSHDSFSHALFSDIMNGSIRHYAILCSKKSHARAF